MRLEVVPAGCSGFSYKFGLISTPDVRKDDKYGSRHFQTAPLSCERLFTRRETGAPTNASRIFEKNGAKVAVDELSTSFLQSCTIDFEKSTLRNAAADEFPELDQA